MENVFKSITKFGKRLLKFKIIIFIIIILIIFAGAAYVETLFDGKNDETDESNIPGSVSKHIKESSFNSTKDGNEIKTKASKSGGYALDIDLDVITDEIIEDLNKNGGNLEVYFSGGYLHEYLKKMIKAEYITQYPDLRTVDKIGTEVPSNEFQGAIKIKRHKSDGTEQLLQYIPLGTEDSTDSSTLNGLIYLANLDVLDAKNKVLNLFSIDAQGNLIVVNWKETTKKSASGEYDTEYKPNTEEVDYSEIDKQYLDSVTAQTIREYSTYSINYKSVVSKYTMPFDYLWAFTVCGHDEEFINQFVDLVLDSSIEISIYDNLVESEDTNIDAYNNNYWETSRVSTRTVTNGKIENETQGQWKELELKSTKHYYNIEYIKSYENTIVTAVTNIDIWYMKYKAEYTYEVKDTGEQKEIARANQEEVGDPNIVTSGMLYNYGLWKTVSTTQYLNPVIVGEVTIIANQEKRDIATKNQKNQCTYTTMYHTIEYKYTLNGVPEVKEKTDNKLKEGDEGYPNFCTIYLNSDNAKRNITGVESWLFEIMESNSSTVNMVELTKYLLYCATDVDYGVTELDLTSLYSPSNNFYSLSSIIGDFNVNDESLFITDIENLKEAFSAYSKSDKLIQYAQEFLNMQNTYKVNALFAAAVSITETSAGNSGNAVKTATSENSVGATEGQCWNNWFNIKTGSTPYGILHNGEGESHYKIYSSVANSVDGFGDLIANGSYYYTQGRYTVNSIGHTYCPNSVAYPTQGDDWVERTLQLINNFYSKVGISIGAPTSGTSDEKLAYLFPKGIPTTKSECESYITGVSVALTTKDGQKTTGTIYIHKSLASVVQQVFQQAQDNGFKIYSAGGFSYREMNNGGSGSLSHHSYGVAIDINVNENYSHRGSKVYAGSFWDPSKSEFSIPRDGVLVKAFEAIGWKWGGNWSGNYQDYMHFSYTGH